MLVGNLIVSRVSWVAFHLVRIDVVAQVVCVGIGVVEAGLGELQQLMYLFGVAVASGVDAHLAFGTTGHLGAIGHHHEVVGLIFFAFNDQEVFFLCY